MVFAAPASLTEQIAEHLGADIIAGRLQPQARIQELKVAGRLGVSRGSVREALLILERRHLVEILPRRGAVVTRLEGQGIAECSELLTELQVLFFNKLAQIRALDLTAFERSLQVMAAAVPEQDVVGTLAARRAFISAGTAALDSFHLAAVLDGLLPAGLRIAHLAAEHAEYDLRDGLRYHQALLKAVTDADSARIRELIAAFNARECKLALCLLTARAG